MDAHRLITAAMAREVAQRYLSASDKDLRDEFDESIKDKKVTNPKTDREIKLKNLRRHADKALRKIYEDAFKKWKGKAEKGKSDVKSRFNSFLSGVKNVSKKMASAVKNAPEETKKLIADKDYRKEAMSNAGKALKKSSKKVGKAAWSALKDEAHATFVESPKIVAKVFKEKRLPTKKEAKTLYGTAVYAGGFALAAIPALPAAAGGAGLAAAIGGAAAAGGSAFANSFSLHVGVKAMSYMFEPDEKFEVGEEALEDLERISKADEGFLGYEAVETVAGVGDTAEKVLGVKGLFSSMAGMLPSSAALYDFSPWTLIKGVGNLVLANKGGKKDDGPNFSSEDEEVMEDFMAQMMENVAKVLEEGFTDEEIERILQESQEGLLEMPEEGGGEDDGDE